MKISFAEPKSKCVWGFWMDGLRNEAASVDLFVFVSISLMYNFKA